MATIIKHDMSTKGAMLTQKGGSSTGVRIMIPILGAIGTGLSAYLVYVHYYQLVPVCLAGFECDAVLSSSFAQFWGIPVSALGLFMYAVVTSLGVWLLFGKPRSGHLISLAIYTLSLSATLFTAYLYYLEIFVLHAFCIWCVGVSLVTVSLLVLSLTNLHPRGSS